MSIISPTSASSLIRFPRDCAASASDKSTVINHGMAIESLPMFVLIDIFIVYRLMALTWKLSIIQGVNTPSPPLTTPLKMLFGLNVVPLRGVYAFLMA